MASDLPQELWALILQHVALADRFKHCALVCQKLSKAAAAATQALVASLRGNNAEQPPQPQQRQQRAEALDSYLHQHGSHVSSLVLDSGWQPLAQLPCPQLVHLSLTDAPNLQLGPHGNLPGVLASCATGLTSLKLRRCNLAPNCGLSRLSVLGELRHLQMPSVQQPGVQQPVVYALLPGSVLPSLTHLTCLDLSQVAVQDVHHVSCLTNLSTLSIKNVLGPQPVRLAPSIAPGFVLPASLQLLRLGTGVELDPAVLSAANQLTRVELESLSLEGHGAGVSSGAALLAAVAGLQQLDSLDLSRVAGIWPAPPAAYTALTASSKLQKLVVRECGLPARVLQHAFPHACRFPALQEFVACEAIVNFWGSEGVSRLVRCCPGLQRLGVGLSAAADVAALQPLTALTKLDLFVVCTDDPADVEVSAAHIVALTQLQRLFVGLIIDDGGDADAAALSGAAGLLPLSALRGLTWCQARLVTQANGTTTTLVEINADNQAGPQQPPDVWLQVLEQCLELSECQPSVTAVAKQQAQQLAEQQEQIAEQQEQIAELQQHCAQQEQRMSDQEQQNAARTAEQEHRFAALQAQVQQLLLQQQQH